MYYGATVPTSLHQWEIVKQDFLEVQMKDPVVEE